MPSFLFAIKRQGLLSFAQMVIFRPFWQISYNFDVPMAVGRIYVSFCEIVSQNSTRPLLV